MITGCGSVRLVNIQADCRFLSQPFILFIISYTMDKEPDKITHHTFYLHGKETYSHSKGIKKKHYMHVIM